MTKSDQVLLARLARALGRGDGTPMPATQEQMARKLGVSGAHVSLVISGARNMSDTLRIKANRLIADARTRA